MTLKFDQQSFDQAELAKSLDSNEMSLKIKYYSLYVLVYENFTEDIINKVKEIYRVGETPFPNKDANEKKYNSEIVEAGKKISKCKKTDCGTGPTRIGSFKYFELHGVISTQEYDKIRDIVNTRNKIVHGMSEMLFKEYPNGFFELFKEMIRIYHKICVWWITEIDMPTSGNFTPEEIDNIPENEIQSGNIMFIMMLEDIVIHGSSDYSEYVAKMKL